jgi:chromosomal replication initiator protein
MNEAKHGGIDIDYSIVEFIANSVTKDIRVMKSLLVRLQAISALKNIDIDIDLCKTVIKENLGDVKLQSVSFVQILSYIAKTQNINKRKIVGKTRNQETVMARQIVMFLTRSLTNLSLKNIGRELGGRDHSTVIHSCNLVENKIKNNSSFRKKMEKIIDDLKKTGL